MVIAAREHSVDTAPGTYGDLVALEPDVPPPHPWLALTEAHRALVDVVTLRLSRDMLRRAPRGDGHPVVVLPGFLGSDGYSAALRRYLAGLDYQVHGWGLGRNLGPRPGVMEALEARIRSLYEHYGTPVSLVGHSLGGIFARELARQFPEWVRQVISLGSPFGRGRFTGSYPARLYMALNPIDEMPMEESAMHEARRCPTPPSIPGATESSTGAPRCSATATHSARASGCGGATAA